MAGSYFRSNVGASVQTNEIDDLAVTIAKLAAAVQDLLPRLDVGQDGDEAAEMIPVKLQLEDATGAALAEEHLVRVWISTTNKGDRSATDNAVVIASGQQLGTALLAHAEYDIITNSSGIIDLEITIDVVGETTRYVMAEIDGRTYSSGAITWAA